MKYEPYKVVLQQDFDGQVWEIREESKLMGTDYDLHCAHITCTFEYNEDCYSGLWSWEMGDHIEAEDNAPWCHFCHVPVPDGLIAIVAMLGLDINKGRRLTTT